MVWDINTWILSLSSFHYVWQSSILEQTNTFLVSFLDFSVDLCCRNRHKQVVGEEKTSLQCYLSIVFIHANIFQIIKVQKEKRHMYPYVISRLLSLFKSLHTLGRLQVSQGEKCNIEGRMHLYYSKLYSVCTEKGERRINFNLINTTCKQLVLQFQFKLELSKTQVSLQNNQLYIYTVAQLQIILVSDF